MLVITLEAGRMDKNQKETLITFNLVSRGRVSTTPCP